MTQCYYSLLVSPYRALMSNRKPFAVLSTPEPCTVDDRVRDGYDVGIKFRKPPIRGKGKVMGSKHTTSQVSTVRYREKEN